jgi:DNA-binding IclR family transcriptional regulator
LSNVADVPAAAQALAILRYLSSQATPVPAATIARELELPRSTVYQLLSTLARQGFVVHLPDAQRWGLGVSAYELGTGYSRQLPLQRLARIPLAQLVDRTGQNAHLAVLHGDEVIYVIEERAPGRAPLVTDVGVRLPAHLTASGRAMLAAMPAKQVLALYPDPSAFVSRTGRGPGSLSALTKLLAQARRDGYAHEDGEVSTDFESVAIAVVDHTNHPVAAIAVTYTADTMSDADRRAIVAAATSTAGAVERRLSGAAQPHSRARRQARIGLVGGLRSGGQAAGSDEVDDTICHIR